MKKINFILGLIVFVLLYPITTFANEDGSSFVNIDDNLTLEIYSDGRVAPIKEPEKLTEKQINIVLTKIGYSNNYIETASLEKKELLVKYGGLVLEGIESNFKHEYVSNGTPYEITAANRDQIREIQIRDLKNRGFDDDAIEEYVMPEQEYSTQNDCSSAIKNCTVGIWTGDISIIKIGETSTTNQFLVELYSRWASQPKAGYKDDNGAIHWGSDAVPQAGTAYSEGASQHSNNDWEYYNLPLDVSNVNGIKAEYRAPVPHGVYKQHSGSIMQVVSMPKRMNGEPFTVSAAYSHPWVLGSIGISIGVAGLTFQNNIILGDRWSWQYTVINN